MFILFWYVKSKGTCPGPRRALAGFQMHIKAFLAHLTDVALFFASSNRRAGLSLCGRAHVSHAGDSGRESSASPVEEESQVQCAGIKSWPETLLPVTHTDLASPTAWFNFRLKGPSRASCNVAWGDVAGGKNSHTHTPPRMNGNAFRLYTELFENQPQFLRSPLNWNLP